MKHIRIIGRIFAALLCAVVIIGAFTGCTSDVTVYKTATQNYSVKPFSFFAHYIRDVYYDQATYYGYDFNEYLSKTASSDGTYVYDYILNVVKESYMQYILVLEKFNEFGLSTDSDEQAEIDKLFSTLTDSFGEDRITEICKELGITVDEFKDYTVGNSSRAADVSDYLFGEGGEYEITDSYMHDYYKEEFRRFKYIVLQFSTDSSTATKEDVAATAAVVFGKAVAGEDFNELIKTYSDIYTEITDDMDDDKKETYTAQNELMLSQGLITDGDGVFDSDYYTNYGSVVDDEILKKVFAMETGEFALIELDDAYWLIELCDNDSDEAFYKSKQSEIFDTLSTPIINELFDTWEKDLGGSWMTEVVSQYDPRQLSSVFSEDDDKAADSSTSSLFSGLSEEMILIIVIGMLIIIVVLIIGIILVVTLNKKRHKAKTSEPAPISTETPTQSLFGDTDNPITPPDESDSKDDTGTDKL